MPLSARILPPDGPDTLDAPILAFDKASVRHFDKDGHLHVAVATLSAACVSPYLGHEIPDWQHLGLDANRVYHLLRPPDELDKAAHSFRGKPLMIVHRPVSSGDHPHRMVVGAIGSDIAFDGERLRGSLTVWDADAIASIENDEQRHLSCGYRYSAVMTPGTWHGIRYDGKMVGLAANHVALVNRGRVPGAIVGDSAMKGQTMAGSVTAATLSRKAVMIAGALQAHIHPLLAADAAVDLRDALKGTTAANFSTRKPLLAHRVKTALAGQLAHDISMKELVELLDRLEGDDTAVGTQPDPDDDDDDDASAMSTEDPADEGNGPMPDDDGKDITPAGQDIPPAAEPETPDNPEGEAPAEPTEAAPAGDTPLDKALAFLKDLIRPEDLAMVQHILKPDTPAPDEPMPDEPIATDLGAGETKIPGAKSMVTKQAMDQAIAAAAKAAEAATIKRLNGITEARTFVKPWVGELHIAADSAEAVLRAALTNLGVEGVKDLHASALRPVLVAQPKPGDTIRARAPHVVAMDAAAKSKYEERFPHANRLASR